MHRLLAPGLVGLLASVALAGCGPRFELVVPDGFVELDRDAQEQAGYALRATSTDGVVIGVKAIEHRVEGDLQFWSEAIAARLRDGEGYALLERTQVTSADGVDGVRMDFARDLDRATYRYTVVVYVTEPTIWLLEAGGEESPHAERAEAVDAAIASFRTR